MKKQLVRFVSLLLVVLTVFSLSIPALASGSYTLSEKEINQIQADYQRHGYVLKKGFWANTTTTGKTAINGVQRLLNACGYSLSIDGSFGPATDTDVRRFQKDYRLAQDGMVGPATIKAMVSAARSKNNNNVLKSATGYNRDKALAYAKANWNNGKGLCAEFASNVIKAGGFTKAWSTGCTTLDRQITKVPGIAKTKLKVESDGSIKLSKNKAANITPGDLIMVWCPYETDGCPYVHVVIVGNSSGDRVQVYAHNSAKNNAVYYGFDYCGYCHFSSKNIVAYLYHFT